MKNEGATPLHIRLLGAPGTGKTQLAADLATALPTQHPGLLFIIDDHPAFPLGHSGPLACATLLMGLDLAAHPASADAQQAADRALRDTLAQAGVGYQVVYGHGEQRLRSALTALQACLPSTGNAAEAQDSRARWVWACDNCSDPQCERRLLSDLLAARTAAT